MTSDVSSRASSLESVKAFWEETPCGEHFVDGLREGSPEYFARITAERYRWEYHLPGFLDEVAAAAGGGRVLEVGSGMGIDASELARRGCQVTAIDLTERGIALAGQNFARLGLAGELRTANAEALPFSDGTFDAVYSFGVLHHSPDTQRALDEVLRVLKPGAKAFVMLYSKYSLNNFAHWVLRRPFEISKAKPDEDAPITRRYTRAGLESLFRRFEDVTFRKRYLFGAGWKPVAWFVPRKVNDLLGRVAGWHWLVVGTKPRS
jgi:ubiquinone/menaquinone biosynthesis C-methylase UbiE